MTTIKPAPSDVLGLLRAGNRDATTLHDAAKVIETLLATIEAQRNAWQPMGSAPKDGDDILVEWFEGGTMLVVSWDGESGRWDTLDGPSYHPEAFKAWQPLPTPALDAALLNRPTERN